MVLTKVQARRFLLRHQNLLPPRALRGKAGALDFVRKVGCIQFDPLDMVGPNPHLVLQSRMKGYRAALLDELLYRDRALVDAFDKNLAIYPVEDWPCFARYREDARQWYGHEGRAHVPMLDDVRAEVAARGPLCSGDLEPGEKVNWPWGSTNASRACLESLYFWGELVVHHKAGTRKFYDLACRHLPADLLAAPDPNTSEDDYYAWHVHRRVGSVGLLANRASDAWLGIHGGLKAGARSAAFERLTGEGRLLSVDVEGIPAPCYVRAQDQPTLRAALEQPEAVRAEAAFLAPLDNLLWDRKLIRELFGFDYTWEVYKPAQQRQYGYYVLPVLCGERFVARMEPRFNRKTKELSILNWWWEPDVQPDRATLAACRRALKDFSVYLGALTVQGSEKMDAPGR